MKLLKSIIALFIIMGTYIPVVFSQTVGSFDTTIVFNEADRDISYYIPKDYNPEQTYKLLIGLHGAGDNSKNYRDAIINQVKWDTIFKNTILVFPDGGSDQSSDFYAPVGDEYIIDSVIALTSRIYNIELSDIILQGFSLGGRSALKYGLDFPEKISRLILNTPAMQSPHDVQNKPGLSLIFNYQNANKLIIGMSHGESDYGFLRTVAMLADSLVEHNAKIFYTLIPNMPHTIPPNAFINYMRNLVYGEISVATPVHQRIKTDLIYYTKKVAPVCRVLSLGYLPINELEITYIIDDNTYKHNWTGTISQEKYEDIVLPEHELSEGYHYINSYISKYNGISMNKTQMVNNAEAEISVFLDGHPIPYTIDFTDSDELANVLTIKPSGNYLTWSVENAGKGNENSFSMLNSILAYTNIGLTESFYTQKFDYTPAEQAAISFDIAYNYSHYTAEYANPPTSFIDTLEILISNDEWKTSKSIFKKWGDDLLTYKEILTNPLSIEAFLTEPDVDEWKNIVVDIPKEDVSKQTMFRFDIISGSGSLIYLDNIKFYDKSSTSVLNNNKAKGVDLSVYPNPASANQTVVMNINSEIEEDIQIDLYNSIGQKESFLFSGKISTGNNAIAIQLPKLSNGVYFIKAIANNYEFIEKIVIQ